MIKLEDLLELAERIQDQSLRKKVIDILKHPSLRNKNLKYKPLKLKKAPASTNWHHVKEGGLIEHTYAVTLMCISVAEILQDVYNLEIDMDSLIAAALVHDIGKLWNFKREKGSWDNTELTLDHTILGTAELYARGFPEPVLHIVASHFGQEGPTPPQTIEALLFHAIDNFDATINGVSEENIIKLILG
ncbi:MAG: dihydroneopterin 2',3'-cyclic phosphate phosphodiesterase, partial [Candidatus Aenigmatarchaeota archaeon]|mgnify:CR=1 FL=1